MLTRKQQWRRIKYVERPTSPVADDRDTLGGRRPLAPKCRPRAIDSLSLEDSLRRLPVASPSRDGKRGELAGTATPPDTSKDASVGFNRQVRVVLVPCRRELRPIMDDLWWGANDYLEFRREYVLAMRATAAAAADQDKVQSEQHQQRSSTSEDDDTAFAATAPAASQPNEPTTAQATEINETIVLPPPSLRAPGHSSVACTRRARRVPSTAVPPLTRSSPSLLFSASLVSPLPQKNAEAAAAAAAVDGTTPSSTLPFQTANNAKTAPSCVKVFEIVPTAEAAAAVRVGGVEDKDGGGSRAAAPGVILATTSISPVALTLASAAPVAATAMRATLSAPATEDDPEIEEAIDGGSEKGKQAALLPPRLPSSRRSPLRSVARVAWTSHTAPGAVPAVLTVRPTACKWTPCAGAAAAAAAAAALDKDDDEGYRTQSLSSASDDFDDGEANRDHEDKGNVNVNVNDVTDEEEGRGIAKTKSKQPVVGPRSYSRRERAACPPKRAASFLRNSGVA